MRSCTTQSQVRLPQSYLLQHRHYKQQDYDDDDDDDSMVACNYFIIFTFLGSALILVGLLFNSALPPLIALYIESQLILEPGSQTYPLWREPPVPVYQRFYFFNVTNAQDVEQRGHLPNLQEIGPFTYRAEWDKRDIEQLTTSTDSKQSDKPAPTARLSFKQFKRWQFEPDLSIADHKIQLVTLNAPLAITLSLIQSASNAVRLLVTFSLDGLSEGFFTKRSVKQLLFDGYPDLLTTFGPLLNAEMLSQGGHFGYMNARNNSLDGTYEVNTGADDISKLNTLASFNGRPELPYWSRHPRGSSCNSLKGASTGDLFPPLEPGQRSVRLFQPDFCRVWRLDQQGDQAKHETSSGLRVTRFTATRDIFRNATDLAENACFFPGHKAHEAAANRVPDPTAAGGHQHRTNSAGAAGAGAGASNRQGRNRQHQQLSQRQQAPLPAPAPPTRHHGHNRVRHEWPAGVFTLAPCKFNAPIYISMPHFLDADPFFSAQVEGMQPDREKHEFFLDLEPRTGSPVMLNARVQLNVAISKPPGLVRFRNVPEIMFPVFWQELSVNVSESKQVVDQLLLASRQVDEATQCVAYIFFLLGAAILVVAALFYRVFQK